MICGPFLKVMSIGRIGFVFWFLEFFVLEYSQDLIAKKSAPASRCALAISLGCVAWRRSHLYTSGTSAFWCLIGPSFVL
jgi:hypothetical protein